MRERDWYLRLAELHALVTPLYQERGLSIPDFQDLQHQLCEYHKYAQIRRGLKQRLKREYTPAVAPRTKKRKTVEPAPPLAPDHGIPDYILADMAQRTAGPPKPGPQPEPPPHPEPPPPRQAPPSGNGGDRHHSSAGESPHGASGKPRGEQTATFIYNHPDRPAPHFYLLVEKRVGPELPNGRAFFQYHWTGQRWQLGVKGTYAERKVPYQLRALKAALAADPNVEVNIAEGEKDTDTLRRLGFVATTNPGGAKQWTDELTAWLQVLGVKRIVLHEDNDDDGRRRTAKLPPLFTSFATVRVVRYPDVPDGEDVTYWITNLGHTKEDLAARIAAAPIADGFDAPKPAPIRSWAGKTVPEQEFTVPDRIPAEQVFLFSGEGGGGKSSMIEHLCAAHVLGREWMGAVPQQGPAVYVECEDAINVLWRRLAAVTAHYGVPIETFADGLHLFSLVEHDSILATTSKRGVVEPTAMYRWLYELAGDLKPVQIGIASAANIFAGSEITRTEVQQFIKLLNRIPALTKGSLVLVSQPSLTGIASTNVSHEGLSGTTQWHNAVRGRAVLKHIKPKNGEGNGVIDTGLRALTFHKNQYGPPVAGCFVRWQNGLYLPVEGTTQDAAERAATAEELTIVLLQRFAEQNRNVSINRNPNNYAPTQFAQTQEAEAAGLGVEDFKRAIDRLLNAGIIENQAIEKGRGRHRLGLKTDRPSS
jgi:RecA-family ATPase